MVKMLETRCDLCGSWAWCGRKCARAPGEEGWTPVYADFTQERGETAVNGYYRPQVEVGRPALVEPEPVNKPDNIDNKLTRAERAVNKIEERKAYMRDKMRARRAAAKAAKA